MRSEPARPCRTPALVLTLIAGLYAVPCQAGIGERAFHQILDLAERVYAGDFLARNLRLQLHRNWQREEHRASASRQEDRYGTLAIISVTGGIARDPAITRDAFALIVCHEIGHHLAGPPQRAGFSAEGQADYFAASECLRRLLPLLPENSMESVPKRLKTDCHGAYPDAEEGRLCLRIAVAGRALGGYFAARRGTRNPDLLARDPRTVEQTRFLSASPQCRLDTYRAGALCNPSANRNRTPHLRWLCGSGNRQHTAGRPPCWYGG